MRDYHAEFAVDHFASHPKMRGHQVLVLLHRLWMCVGNPWADAPRISIAASRFSTIVCDRMQLCKLVSLLVKVGAITKLQTGRSGTLYELCKPEHTELSAEMQQQIATMCASDYRCKPRLQPTRAQLELVSSNTDAELIVLEDERRWEASEAGKAKKKKKVEVRAWMREQGIQRSDVARILCAMIGKPDGTLLYAGKGSTAVTATLDWMTTEMVTWEEFNRVAERIFRDKSEDKPKRVEFVFECGTEERREYVATMLDIVRAKLRAKSARAVRVIGDDEINLEAGRAELADLTEEQRRRADPTNIYGTY